MTPQNRSRVRAFFFHAWPSKVLSLLAAVLVWWFATVGDTPVTQASRVVPLDVQGLSSGSVASGVPETAILTFRGPSVLIERIQAQSLGAVIDLSGESGEFEEPINVMIPQGVELIDVSPGSVIGTVQALQEETVPVEPVIIGPQTADVRVELTVEPPFVTVSGVDPALSRVTRVFIPVRASAGERTLTGYAADLNGQPVGNVTVAPAEVTVSVTELPVLAQATVSIEFVPPAVPGFNVSTRLETSEQTITGPPSLLAGMESVNGTISEQSIPAEPGSYTVPVELDLPEGVAPSGQPRAVLRLSALVPEE